MSWFSKTSGSRTSTSTVLTKELLIRVIKDFKKEVFKEVTNSIQFLSDKIDSTISIMESIETELAFVKKDNEGLHIKNSKLEAGLNNLKGKVCSLEQNT